MTTNTVRDLVDELDTLDLVGLMELSSPCVSFYLPAGRTRDDANRAPLELRALVRQAREELPGHDTDDSLLDEVVRLAEDQTFWNFQAEGLAIFASHSATRVIRLAIDPGRRVSVGKDPHLVPLVDTIDHHSLYYLLAVGLGRVRLFGGTWSTLEELDLGPIPASVEDMERRHQSEPELQHQHTPAARGVATFHGHGGREVSDVVVDKFLHEVAVGVRQRIGAATTTPIYLAGVQEHLPRLRATGQLPTLRTRMIAGGVDNTPAHELLEDVRRLVADDVAERDLMLRDDLDRAAGQGLRETRLDQIVRAAVEGRVATLVVDASQVAMPEATIDHAVARVLDQGGEVRTLTALPEGAPVVAVLRY